MPYPYDEPDTFPVSRKLCDAYRHAERLTRENAPKDQLLQAWKAVGEIEREEFNAGSPEVQW